MLEVACGTGFVTYHLLAGLGSAISLAACSDVDPLACEEAKLRLGAAASAPRSSVVLADMAEAFREGAFDAVIFNPPYLPPEPGLNDPTVHGGIGLISSMMASSARALRPGGLLMALARSEDREAAEAAAEAAGLRAEGVACRLRLFFEELVVLKAVKPLSL